MLEQRVCQQTEDQIEIAPVCSFWALCAGVALVEMHELSSARQIKKCLLSWAALNLSCPIYHTWKQQEAGRREAQPSRASAWESQRLGELVDPQLGRPRPT